MRADAVRLLTEKPTEDEQMQVLVTIPEREDLRPVADEAGVRIRPALDALTDD